MKDDELLWTRELVSILERGGGRVLWCVIDRLYRVWSGRWDDEVTDRYDSFYEPLSEIKTFRSMPAVHCPLKRVGRNSWVIDVLDLE